MKNYIKALGIVLGAILGILGIIGLIALALFKVGPGFLAVCCLMLTVVMVTGFVKNELDLADERKTNESQS